MKINPSKRVLEANSFTNFNEMQEKCLKFGLEKSMVVSAPTASGKTIVAELYMFEHAFNKREKVVYTCPLKALASEHYHDFKKKYPELSFALSTGDFDSSSSYLKKFDVIFTTYEKLASLLRHNADWLSSVGCLIVDEIHEIDSSRGPTIEVALTQMMFKNPKLKILALSATIPNSKELANWLNAMLIESNFRPTKLKEGVLYNSTINYNDGTIEEKTLEEKIEEALSKGNQILFFYNSRKSAESNAKKFGKIVSKKLNTIEEKSLKKIALNALNALENPTEQCKALSNCIQNGTAFHHAGLVDKQRKLVEDYFRNGRIKILCSTTTLSMGINAPADIVIIPSLYRFGEFGMELISVREYKQMVGRSGRPKFSNEGKSITIANSEAQKELYVQEFVNGSLESIESKLSIQPILRTHILALIASNVINDIKSAEAFFEKTFYSQQYQNISEIIEKVANIIEELEEFKFIEKRNEKFFATKIGKRISDLYLDPISANFLIKALSTKKTFTNFSYIYSWVNCFEFGGKFKVPKNQEALINEELHERFVELPVEEEIALYEIDSLERFFSAIVIEKWINEESESKLLEEYNASPGAILEKTRALEWLAYSTIELSKILGLEKHIIPVQKLSKRIKHGVKEELLQLVELSGVGRVRARKLFNVGIRKPSDVKNNPEQIQAILGKKVSEKILKQFFKEEQKYIQKSL